MLMWRKIVSFFWNREGRAILQSMLRVWARRRGNHGTDQALDYALDLLIKLVDEVDASRGFNMTTKDHVREAGEVDEVVELATAAIEPKDVLMPRNTAYVRGKDLVAIAISDPLIRDSLRSLKKRRDKANASSARKT